jgi:hypothetical protein
MNLHSGAVIYQLKIDTLTLGLRIYLFLVRFMGVLKKLLNQECLKCAIDARIMFLTKSIRLI